MRKTPLLSRLGDDEIRALLDACFTEHMAPGAQVFSPNQQADSFYVILAGRAKVYKLSPKGDEQILHLYGPGDTFGQAAMWAGVNYPAHAEVHGAKHSAMGSSEQHERPMRSLGLPVTAVRFPG